MTNEIWNYSLFEIGDYSLQVSKLVVCLCILIATFLFSKLVRMALNKVALSKHFLTPAQVYIVGRLLHYIILVIGILLAISALGIDVGKLALVASALGIGIGLGLQGIVNNFVSGLAILLEKSVKVGDFIELDSGINGEVMAIHMRATLVRTNDNVDILIPNSELTNQKVINWTLAESVRRFRIPFGVAYGSDKRLVEKAVLEATEQVDYTLNTIGRKPVVWMTGFGDSSINFMLGVWVSANQVKRPTALTSDYLWAIDDALRKYKIEIPFPQRDLHIRSNKAGVGVNPAETIASTEDEMNEWPEPDIELSKERKVDEKLDI
ncbi:mechanosensitive ion channel family protein [Flocculibacter collagenilyticus]|uniref:mechanosensitive ion channel family protein n=1 Tax=Flocculibacter collagenilyticus TaxID=2744479 RepID=UPI0018F5FDE2|nr:mechanosensitive ion channel domain-containing protein [Flocculibacter collagenilyticus]